MNTMSANEEWRKIEGFENMFSVSSLGRVRRDADGQIRKEIISDTGYRYASLYCKRVNGKKKATATVHSLVAAAFLGPRPDGFQVNHKDGDKANNTVGNLEYLTPSENTRHALRNGLRSTPKGTAHWNVKLTPEQVGWIRRVAWHYSHPDIAYLCNVHTSVVKKIIRGESWRHLLPQQP